MDFVALAPFVIPSGCDVFDLSQNGCRRMRPVVSDGKTPLPTITCRLGKGHILQQPSPLSSRFEPKGSAFGGHPGRRGIRLLNSLPSRLRGVLMTGSQWGVLARAHNPKEGSSLL